MTMRIALSSATVTDPDGVEHARSSVLSRNGTFVVRTRSGEVLFDLATTGVAPDGRRRWTVQTELGQFSVERRATDDCGCGGSR